ncbi:hypothetical protein ACJMK2_027224 [Sinanodonta woodiana]|uniref:Uncharacterized protein n=1 Tax=Sinanodonta woodiana TaxID=1069815 RepID=A0ABD3XNU5_SINWO
MKGIYIAALAVFLCCHILLVQSSDTPGAGGKGKNKGKNSGKKVKPSAKKNGAPSFSGVDSAAESQGVPMLATDNSDINPFVISELTADQESAGDQPPIVTQSPALQPGKGKGNKSKSGKNKGGSSKPMKAADKGGANSKNKGKQGAKKPSGNKSKTGSKKSN